MHDMKKLVIMIMVSCLCASSANAQSMLERLGQKAKQTVENKISEKAENAISNGIDKATKKKGNAEEVKPAEPVEAAPQTAPAVQTVPAPAAPAQGGWNCPDCGKTGNTGEFCEDCGAKKPAGGAAAAAPDKKKAEIAYAKSDFVPGDEIIFDDDFANEQLGEFPSKWDVRSGNAEVATIDGRMVIMCADGGTTVYPLMKNPHGYLSEAFTIEYDFYLGEEDAHVDVGLKFFNPEGSLGYWSMDWDGFTWALDKPTDGDTRGNKFWDDAKAEGLFNFNAWNHIAISFNKRAFKAYVNGTRITNVPNMAAPKYVEFEISPNEKNGYNGISNVRIANGAVPLYDRLSTDGKIITYAITFETGKADIKPESYVEINRIAKLMQENPNLSFEVQGHCDASGSDKVNDPLSQKRAEAIVAALVEQGIAQARLTAVGKGSHQPIADNSSDEGRAKNRRVEFVKK